MLGCSKENENLMKCCLGGVPRYVFVTCDKQLELIDMCPSPAVGNTNHHLSCPRGEHVPHLGQVSNRCPAQLDKG